MQHNTTLYLYKLAWMLPSVAILAGTLAALLVTAFGAHIGVPGAAGRFFRRQGGQTRPQGYPPRLVSPFQYTPMIGI